MEELKQLLNKECDRTLSSEQWDEVFALAEVIHLKKGQPLILPGEVKPDIYIVKEGIMRGIDFNGDRERTFCFGLPGTIFNSRFSFYRGLPSYYQIEACTPSVVLRIRAKTGSDSPTVTMHLPSGCFIMPGASSFWRKTANLPYTMEMPKTAICTCCAHVR